MVESLSVPAAASLEDIAVEIPARHGMGGWLHGHTYTGRYEEYRAQYEPLLDATEGWERYEFQKALEADARAYARRQIIKDVLGTVVIAGGLAGVIYETKTGSLSRSARRVVTGIEGWPTKFGDWMTTTQKTIGKNIAQGALDEIQRQEGTLQSLVRGLTVDAVQTATDAAGIIAKNKAASGGLTVAEKILSLLTK